MNMITAYPLCVCIMHDDQAGGRYDPTRLRVRQWVEEYAKARGVSKCIAGQVGCLIGV